MNSYALTSVARLKTFLGITVNTDDTLLERIIDAVTDWVINYTGREFQLDTYTQEIYDGSGTHLLLLNNYPIDDTTAVVLEARTTPLNVSDWDTIDTELYHVDFERGMIDYQPRIFTRQPRHYRVTYKAGFDFDNTGAVKTLESVGLSDLEWAVWELCKAIYNARKQASNVQSESIGDYSVTFTKELFGNPDVKAILDAYARPEDNM